MIERDIVYVIEIVRELMNVCDDKNLKELIFERKLNQW